jgi:hypothetical protein
MGEDWPRGMTAGQGGKTSCWEKGDLGFSLSSVPNYLYYLLLPLLLGNAVTGCHKPGGLSNKIVLFPTLSLFWWLPVPVQDACGVGFLFLSFPYVCVCVCVCVCARECALHTCKA